MSDVRIAVVGGGIAGLAAAHRLVCEHAVETVLFEAADRIGGRVESAPFAGVHGLDSGADAFLARVPDAIELARAVGLGDELVSPEPVGAAVWYDGMHDIPEGLLLGVPGRLAPLVRSGLLSWRGTARAALEPLLPRTSTESDSIGDFVRARFGDEVHERLVDALVGSIYATDTDHFSLAEVPQLAALASSSRSVLLAARRQRSAQGTATAAASPVFATPRGGMQALTDAVADAIGGAGGELRVGASVTELAHHPGDHRPFGVDGQRFDGVVLATPAPAAAALIDGIAPEAAAPLRAAVAADVVMVTLHIGADQWPASMVGRSGYLVPKPVQGLVTAASFGSQKWAHWRPEGGGQILRVSLGRDGRPVLHLDDDRLLDATLAEVGDHLQADLAPIDHRITRWPGAFAQYRPHHRRWVESVERHLPAGIEVAGASYRGIGIPACVRDGRAAADRVTPDPAER